MGAGHLKVPKEVVCATCGTSFLGLLCMNCNTGLGQFKDDTSVLQNAINYLTKFKELKRVKGV